MQFASIPIFEILIVNSGQWQENDMGEAEEDRALRASDREFQ